MILTIKCNQCGKEFKKEFPDEKISRFIQGKELIQRIFPELSDDDRELYFITHLCPKCWDDIFGVDTPNGYQEEYATDIEDIDRMAEEYYELQAEIAHGK